MTDRAAPAGTSSTNDEAIDREVVVAAPPEVVWQFWTDPTRLVRWMGSEATLDPRPGGEIVIRYGNGAAMRGEVVELDEPRRLVFTWGWEDPTEIVRPGASRVEVTLDAVDEGTRVHVRHLGLPTAERAGHVEGWDYFLGRLLEAAA